MDYGIVIAIVVCIGGIIVRDRYIMSAIAKCETSMLEHVNEASRELHVRVNDVRDSYVRRDDLDAHLKRIEKGMEIVQTEQKETNRLITSLMASIANDRSNRA